ncbi:MAG: radical SAM protein [Lachnospiraceae bacterium]|nr:radical SAM protein [Lachnospiraceae bacterium]
MMFKVQTINRHRMKVDGEGVTTLVGLYGCPLQCKYCINETVLKEAPYKEYTPDALLQVVMQDYCYFVATNGGVTFGGGESLLHSEVIQEFIRILPEHVSVNLETSLNVKQDAVIPLLEPVHQFIIDIKSMNGSIYEAYTKLPNQRVLENLQYIAEHNYQHKCRIRVPRIPEFNDEADIENSVSVLRNLGFENIDVFSYIIKED